MQNYQNSGDAVNVTLGAGESVSSGDLVEINSNMFGVAQTDGAEGDTVACVRKGRFELSINAGPTGAAGDPVYQSGSGCDVQAFGPKIGYLASALGATDTVADVVMMADAGSVYCEGVATLDVADQGGEIAAGSDIEFGASLPSGAVLVECWINVKTTFVSATDAATIALGLDTDAEGEIDAAIAISAGGNPWDAGMRISDVSSGGAATTALTGSRRFLAQCAGGEDITAGALDLYYRYFVPGQP